MLEIYTVFLRNLLQLKKLFCINRVNLKTDGRNLRKLNQKWVGGSEKKNVRILIMLEMAFTKNTLHLCFALRKAKTRSVDALNHLVDYNRSLTGIIFSMLLCSTVYNI